MRNILLACGSGASSGFIAQQMRKAAKKKGLNIRIKAVSDTEIKDNLDNVGVLMLGPHLAFKVEEIKSELVGEGIKVSLISKNHYASLDGVSVLEQAVQLMEGENNG